MTLANQAAVTPAGKPVAAPMPVAPVVVRVIAVKAVLIQRVGVEEGTLTVLFGNTVIVPDFEPPLPPVALTVKGNEPDAAGVPLIVMVSFAQTPVTPAGKPKNDAPVTPLEVAYLKVSIAVLMHGVWLFKSAGKGPVIVANRLALIIKKKAKKVNIFFIMIVVLVQFII